MSEEKDQNKDMMKEVEEGGGGGEGEKDQMMLEGGENEQEIEDLGARIKAAQKNCHPPQMVSSFKKRLLSFSLLN